MFGVCEGETERGSNKCVCVKEREREVTSCGVTNLGSGIGDSMSDVSYKTKHILRANHPGNPHRHVVNEPHWVAKEVNRTQDYQRLAPNVLESR